MENMFIAFFEFLGETNAFIQWSALWLLWGVYFLAVWPFRLVNRFFRSRNIKNAGWPSNPLMDADGDINHPSKDDEQSNA